MDEFTIGRADRLVTRAELVAVPRALSSIGSPILGDDASSPTSRSPVSSDAALKANQ